MSEEHIDTELTATDNPEDEDDGERKKRDLLGTDVNDGENVEGRTDEKGGENVEGRTDDKGGENVEGRTDDKDGENVEGKSVAKDGDNVEEKPAEEKEEAEKSLSERRSNSELQSLLEGKSKNKSDFSMSSDGDGNDDELLSEADTKLTRKSENISRRRTDSWGDVGKDDDLDLEYDDEEDDLVEGELSREQSDDDIGSVGGAASSATGGGGMMDLLGRSKAAKEELAAKEAKEAEMKKRKRKRKVTDKEKGKDKDAGKDRKKSIRYQQEMDAWVDPEYESDEFISKPICNTDMIPKNILKFYESYGYDCGRRDNLHMIDENTLIFISGNYLHFYSLQDSEVFLCRRAATGYGLGHIALHPSREYFAVGEKGHNPVIVIYTWPSVSVYRILRRGTLKGYSFLNFSPPGDFLCSQGMDPDYMLTIWDWAKEKVLLRCKAFSNDIFRVSFSPTLPGDLTTCGVGHIRFWKMAETFTGLKLQGAIGRFGKTEISDIQDYVELPNGKVLSGCEWGNILVWDGGLIVCEICGLNDETLHKGEITSLIMMTETNEILTVGKDGYLKIWDVDTLDIADTLVDDSGKYVVEPTHEIRLSGDAAPQGCIKNLNTPPPPTPPALPTPTEPGDPLSVVAVAAATETVPPIIPSMWYCQDSWGRIWDVNIAAAIQDNTYSSSPIFYTPGGGPINCLVCSVEHTIFAVGTAGGHLWIIDYITKNCLVRKHYKTSVSKIFWLPQKYDPRGVTFLVGFGDGCIRSYSIQPITPETEHDIEDEEDDFRRGHPSEIGLNQVLRFCKGVITVMKFDEENEILYVCGEDRVLWGVYLFYDEEEDCTVMEPLAYFKTPFAVYHIDLHPLKPYRMILAGKTSRIAECRRPEWTEYVTEKSFFQGKLRGRRWWFNSSKSERRKTERREWRKKERERELKELGEDIKRRVAMGVAVEEDIEYARLNEKFRRAQMADDEEPIYRPEKPSTFLGVYYHINPSVGDKETMAKTFFVHMGDYDAGYIYECKCTRPEIGGFHGVPPTPPFEKSDDTDVAVKCWLLSDDDDFLLFGMADGSIRVMPRVNVNAKIEEMMRLEREAAEEEARKKKRPSGQQEEDADKSDMDTEATTAPPISVDQEIANQRNKDKSDKDDKKKRKSSAKKEGGIGGVPPFTPSIYPYDLENFFCLPMHDPNRGAVVEMCWSGDGQFLISVGADGSIFSYRWDPDGYLEFATDNLPASHIPSDMLDYEFLADEEDPNMLTVEETKQQEEREKVRGMQEEFKEDVRAELRDLREVFKNIKQRNKEIPEQYRLTEEELKLPDEIYAELQGKLDEEVEEVFRIHEYESAENIIQMEKIEKNFFKPILYPHIAVKDISHKIETHTIRQKKLSEEFVSLVEKNKEVMNQEQIRSNVSLEVKESLVEDETPPITRVYAKDIIGEYEHKLPTYNVETLHNIRHLETRLEERYHREVAWQELLKRKIQKDFIDPEDRERLHHAKTNRGDFKLQAVDTFLGDHETIAERRQKIINMKLWIHRKTEDYNKKVIECRDEKLKILQECRALESKIKLIQPFVPPELRRRLPPIYDMTREENPECEFDITQEEVEFEENTELHAAGLLEFRDQMNEELFGIMRPEKPLVVEEEIKDFLAPSVRHTKSIDLEFENMTVHKFRKYMFTARKDQIREQSRLEAIVWPKLIEQEMLFKELLEIIEYFHCRVKYLHDYKIKMDIDLHIKMIGLITLIRELDIAKEFEIQERGILERLRVQKEEFHDARHKLDKVRKHMTKMNAEVKKMEGEVAVLQTEVQNVIGESGKWGHYLTKVFNKKVKLAVPEEDENVDGDETKRKMSSSSESSDKGDSNSQYDTRSSVYKVRKMKLDLDECPEHLDKMIYNKVCDYRMRKAVIELAIENEKKAVEQVADEFVEIEGTCKTLEERLTDTGEEIRMLQRRRQKRMNELKCMLVMRIDQINCVDMEEVGDVGPGGVFEKLVKTFPSENKILVFPQGKTDQLRGRADELHQLKQQELERMNNGRQMQLRLVEELKKAEKRVDELKVKAKKDMVLKFGREVDLDKVCAAIINLELLDKEIQLEKLRKLHYYQRQQLIDGILDAKDELTGEIRENSNLKILEAMILERKRDLDYFVYKNIRDTEKRVLRDASRKNMTTDRRKRSKQSTSHETSDIDLRRDPHFFQQQTSTDVDKEIQDLKKTVRHYELKAQALRQALKVCKRKSGLPPILQLNRNQGLRDAAALQQMRNGNKFPPIKYPEGERIMRNLPKLETNQKQTFAAMMQDCGTMGDPMMTTFGGVKTLYKTEKRDTFDQEMTLASTVEPSQIEITRVPSTSSRMEEMEEFKGDGREPRRSLFDGEVEGERDDPEQHGSTVRFFEEQFDQYLTTERDEVMEYLGEVDDEMISQLATAVGYSESEDEESEMEGLTDDDEEINVREILRMRKISRTEEEEAADIEGGAIFDEEDDGEGEEET